MYEGASSLASFKLAPVLDSELAQGQTEGVLVRGVQTFGHIASTHLQSHIYIQTHTDIYIDINPALQTPRKTQC